MLEFGTAGIRGIMGEGEDRINNDVIRKATQALANFLNEKYGTASSDAQRTTPSDAQRTAPSVVISYDSRNNSHEFAKSAASVLAGNGIRAILWPEMMPVPVLSFSVRYLGCDAGIMITASHNPKEYNGYKVYGPNGGQILEKDAMAIQSEIQRIDDGDIKSSDAYELADMEIYDAYRKAMEDAGDNAGGPKSLKIVYTPLNGSGRKPVTDMLKANGYSYTIVREQEMPDGDFTTCPSPNPEKDEVYEIALKYAAEIDADIIVATDPDCDRVGCMAKDSKTGNYTVISGNELGTLMTYYFCKSRKNVNSLAGTVVCSIVSTPIIERIAEAYSCKVERTPVGFKYIGDKMDVLGDRFIFGFEESNGFLVGDYARDKDGVVGTKIILGMAEHYKATGKTLVDVLNEIYEKFGLVINKTISKDLKPGDIKPEMSVTNYDDGSRVIIRPSGTEPKVKYYFSAPSEDRLNELKSDLGI